MQVDPVGSAARAPVSKTGSFQQSEFSQTFRARNRAVAIAPFAGPSGRARTSAAVRHRTCRGHWSIAQSPERLAHIEEVGGSIPSGPTTSTTIKGIDHWQGPPSRKRNFIQTTSRHERSTGCASSSERYLERIWLKGPGCYPGRSAHVRWRKGPNPFLVHCRLARRAVNSNGPGSNPGRGVNGHQDLALAHFPVLKAVKRRTRTLAAVGSCRRTMRTPAIGSRWKRPPTRFLATDCR